MNVNCEEETSFETKKRKKRRTTITRTGCKAGVRVKLDDEGYFVVVDHVLEHNHDLTPTQWQHHHRSERAIPAGEGDMIKVMTEARMPPSIQYRYLPTRKRKMRLIGVVTCLQNTTILL
ncbi:hypothetical protein RND81_04G145100 [Saponaria officinalis]|uniref:FAR1 domain-containing protein n=1 Tax=Saponaria officinalis TaxID=3572 RepID=A0AAW1LLA0_SAPOF